MLRRPSLLVMLMFILRSFAFAADPPLAARHVAPFVDEQTFAIVHLDTQRMDLDALQKQLNDLIPKLPPEQQRQVTTLMNIGIPVLKAGHADFKKAGARHAYFIFTMSDILSSPGFAMVPLEEGADAKAISSLLFSGRVDGPSALAANQSGWPETAEKVDGAVVMGTRGMVKRLAQRKAQPRPDIEAAFAAVPDATIQVVILMPDDVRKVIDGLWPTLLPADVGQVPSTVLTSGFVNSTIALDFPPQLSFKLTIQAKDAKAADALGDLISDSMAVAFKNARVRHQIPIVGDVLPQLTPKIDNDKLVLSLDKAATEKVFDQMVAMLGAGRAKALHMQTSSNMRQILMAGLMFARDNKGEWPQALDQLAPKYLRANVLNNPNEQAPFVYIRPAKGADNGNTGTVIVLYEDPEKAGGQNAFAGFLDGHVEMLRVDDLKGRIAPK